MECLLCHVWNRMPHAKRWSTPTSAQETEGALIIGYWFASRNKAVPRICERHMAVLEALDRQEEQRIAAEQNAKQNQVNPLPPEVQQQIAQFQLRQQQALRPPAPPAAIQPPLPVPIIQLDNNPVAIPVPQVEQPFSLGMTPLVNENTVTAQPPLPMGVDLSAPYRAQPGTPEGALEAARMPAVEGGKVTYPCPACQKEISTGDVHVCEA